MSYAQQISALQRELARLRTMRQIALSLRRRRALDVEINRVEARIAALRRAAATSTRRAAPPPPPPRPPRAWPILPAWPSPSAPAQASMDPSVADQEAAMQAALTAADQAQVQAVEDSAAAEPSAASKYGIWFLLALAAGGYALTRGKGKKRADAGAA